MRDALETFGVALVGTAVIETLTRLAIALWRLP